MKRMLHTAPCGMNCVLCIAYQRKKKNCLGCNGPDEHKPYHCTVCRIKYCENHDNTQAPYCFSCEKFPCPRLKQLDKRYRQKYGMSLIENLKNIQTHSLNKYTDIEVQKWICPKCNSLLCAHRNVCLNCGSVNNNFPKE